MSLNFSVIEVRSLTPENLKHVCDVALRFGFTGICHMTTEYDKFQFLDHSGWGVPPIDEEAKSFMINHQREVREASEYVCSRGLRFYMWRRELRLPVGFIEKYGVDWVDFSNPEVWTLVNWNIRELFKIVPLCHGLLLSCTGEQKAGEWITANGVDSELPLADCFERMFNCVYDVCAELGKEVIIRNHGAGEPGLTLDGGDYMDAFLEGAKRVSPKLRIMAKANEHDFQVAYPFNLVLARMASQLPTVAEFAIAMEYNGVGKFPCPNVEQLEFMMRYVRANKMDGVALRYDWYPCEHQNTYTYSVHGNMNEVNAYAFGRLLNEPGVRTETLYRDFCKERFGEKAAQIAFEIYRDLFEAGGMKQSIFGHQTSSTPSGHPMDPATLFSMLRCAPRDRWSILPGDFVTGRKILDPDDNFIESVREEKKRAELLYTKALTTLRDHRTEFEKADADMIELGLVRALKQLAIQRSYYVAVLLGRRYELHEIEPCYTQAMTLLDDCRHSLAEYREQYDLTDSDPTMEQWWSFGKSTSHSVDKAQDRLTEAHRWAQQHPGHSLLLKPSSQFLDAVELRSQRFVISIDPYTAHLHELVLDNQVLAKDAPFVEITEGGLFLKPDKLSGHLCRACRMDGNHLIEIFCKHNDLRISLILNDTTGDLAISYTGTFAEDAEVKVLTI